MGQELKTSITVTATRGALEEASTSLPVVMTGKELGAPASVEKMLAGANGVVLQSTTPGQASPALRGLTGYQTLLLVDGVRLNTSIFRSGPNQYSAFLDASQVERAEVVLGPVGAAYGSDAMGGAIQFVSKSLESHARRVGLTAGGAAGDFSGLLSPEAGFDSERWSVLGSAYLRRHNDIRGGGGLDSHNVYTRYAGLSLEEARARMGERMPETAYTQAGFASKIVLKLRPEERVSFVFDHGTQYGVRGYRELMGGQGRLKAVYTPQTLDLGYLRYEREKAYGLDRLMGRVSYNRQRDDSTRQGPNWTDAVIVDRNRVRAFGYAVEGAKAVKRVLVLGGVEGQGEEVRSYRSVAPAQFPDGAGYGTAAPFVQVTGQPWGRVRVQGGLRWTRTVFELPVAQRVPGLGGRQEFGAAVGNAGLSARIWKGLEVVSLYGQGFRAPNVSDLGATGLTTQGFEIPAGIAAAAGGLVGLDGTEGALPRVGVKMRALEAERLTNYEAGLRYRGGKWVGRVQGFVMELDHPIVRRTVLFAAGTAPASLNGIAVTAIAPTAAQRAAGVVTVATAYDGRAVKSGMNDGGLRYQGISAEGEWQATGKVFLSANYSYMNGREILPNRAPRRLPPQQGAVKGVWRVNSKFSVQVLGLVSGEQTKLSTGDLDDERMGASRSRRDIAAFLATPVGRTAGVNVKEVQDRLLPLGAVVNGVLVASETTKVPMLAAMAGWVRVDGGVSYEVKRGWRVSAGLENVLDASYRVLGSGADGVGRNGYVRTEWRW